MVTSYSGFCGISLQTLILDLSVTNQNIQVMCLINLRYLLNLCVMFFSGHVIDLWISDDEKCAVVVAVQVICGYVYMRL